MSNLVPFCFMKQSLTGFWLILMLKRGTDNLKLEVEKEYIETTPSAVATAN